MSGLDLSFLEDGRQERDLRARRRARLAMAVSAAVTVIWLIHVTSAGHWTRVTDNWAASLTMVFGSFVAGSTPQGGGAVAFPVFTKILEIPTEVARSFSLCIQAVGMACAAAAIIINRRSVAWRAVAVGTPVAAVTFLATAYLAGKPDELFWPSRLPGPYVKVTFTLIVAAMAFVVFLGWRSPVRRVRTTVAGQNRRLLVALILAGALGGAATALVGSGVDVFVYLFVVVLFGVDPRIGVPTSVIPMAAISVLGFVFFGLIDGQLATEVSGAQVVSVGSQAVTGAELPADRFDLYGLWLAAVPVVAWGAPLGSWVAARLSQRQLVAFVLLLATTETVSTVVFLDDLRSNPTLAAYALVGLVVVAGTLAAVTASRRQLFGLDAFDPASSMRRADLDVNPDFRKQLDAATLETDR